MTDARPLRILCLDGSGMQGIASLVMLESIMDQVQLQLPWAKQMTPLRPCDYFDLICGTSTGGLIALLLGRLRYTITDAMMIYQKMAAEVFSEFSEKPGAMFSHAKLEEHIKDAVTNAPAPKKKSLRPDEALEDPSIGKYGGGARTFVIAIHPEEVGVLVTPMRTYNTTKGSAFKATIWEAGRATSASPPYFAPIKINDVLYRDGTAIASNPVEEAKDEAFEIWGSRPIGCLVSIGLGLKAALPLEEGDNMKASTMTEQFLEKDTEKTLFEIEAKKYCAKCLGISESAHRWVVAGLKRESLVGKYFRLNVPVGMENIGLEDWEKISLIRALTSDYMDTVEGKLLRNHVSQILAKAYLAQRSGYWFNDTVEYLWWKMKTMVRTPQQHKIDYPQRLNKSIAGTAAPDVVFGRSDHKVE